MAILRIVKMDFRSDEVQSFDELFEEIQGKIEAMPGCKKVVLLKSDKHPSGRTTLSWWDNEGDLKAYRTSRFFGEIWPQTKAKFQNKAVAWSLEWNEGEALPLGV